uniref:Uncharacterized protein n=1 Tax=Solanum tuberosum TaxID=4113 RepID=M1DE53_SOLTU
MGDQIQHQLAQLVNLSQEERAANLARHEATNARLDALTQDLVNSKVDFDSTEHISQNRGWKGTWSSAEYEYSSNGQSAVQLESCLRQKVGEAAEYSTNQKRRGCLFIG